MITFFHITLGEQVPKILALQRAESIILFAVQPVSAMAWVLRPFISLLYLFTNLVLRTIGLEYHGEEHAVHSPEELQLLVTQSARAGLMTAPERELVQRALAFGDQTAGEIMVPRTEIIALSSSRNTNGVSHGDLSVRLDQLANGSWPPKAVRQCGLDQLRIVSVSIGGSRPAVDAV